MFSNCRISYTAQKNLHIEKEKWKQWADVYFEKVINHDKDENDSMNRTRMSVKTESI